jgi:hypothetical protein
MLFILGMILLPQISQLLYYLLHIILICSNINFCIFDGLADRENTIKIIEFINKDKDTRKSMLYYSSGKKEPSGICFSFKRSVRFICYIKNENRIDNGRTKLIQTIYLLGKIPVELVTSTFDIDPVETDDEHLTKNYIEIWDKSHDYRDAYIYKMMIPFHNKPYEKQDKIMTDIMSLYKTSDNNIVRTLIWGNPGLGKSYLGKLLAHKMNGQLSTFISLTTPGCGFRSLYKSASPKLDSPLIIQIDEIDVCIKKIHEQGIKDKHEWLDTACIDKAGYNNFWSEFVTRFPYVIWILTMNSTPDQINRMDECYIRQNRVDLSVEYK